jgi:hypothetical protein
VHGGQILNHWTASPVHIWFLLQDSSECFMVVLHSEPASLHSHLVPWNREEPPRRNGLLAAALTLVWVPWSARECVSSSYFELHIPVLLAGVDERCCTKTHLGSITHPRYTRVHDI